MLKRFIFRRQKLILAIILWLCLIAAWIRSNVNYDPKRGFHRGIHPNPHGRAHHFHNLELKQRDIVKETMSSSEGFNDTPVNKGKTWLDETGDKKKDDDIVNAIQSKTHHKSLDRTFEIYNNKNYHTDLLENNPVVKNSGNNVDYIKEQLNSRHLTVKDNNIIKDREDAVNSLMFIRAKDDIKSRHNPADRSTGRKTSFSRKDKSSKRGTRRYQKHYPVKSNARWNLHEHSFPRCLVEGVYWNPKFVEALPRGIEPSEADDWLQKIRNIQVKDLQKPTWNRCGRPKNGYAEMATGYRVCARYRTPQTRLIQGEVLSYWLARYFDLTTVPPVALSLVNSNQWAKVTDSVKELGWDPSQFVALIMWMDAVDSSPHNKVYMPIPVLEAIRLGKPVSIHKDANGCGGNNQVISQKSHPLILVGKTGDVTENGTMGVTLETMIQIAMWGNLIIFDYLTGNYDRIASMQDSAEKENKPGILYESIRNLHRSSMSPLLWFLDNESGLLDAYELMYQGGQSGWRFYSFHQTMLESICVFDKHLIDKVRLLHGFEHPDVALEDIALEQEPALSYLKADKSHILFETHFKERLKQVLDWVDACDGKVRS